MREHKRNESHVTCDIAKTCTLDCFACRRQKNKYEKIPPGGWNGQNMPLGDLEKLCDVFEDIGFCGQVSDPIFHPEFHELLRIIERNNRTVAIHTAATSPKLKMEFYEKAFEVSPNSVWFFGIDGLPHKSPMYRINQDGEFLFDVMSRAPNAVWQWIVFGYNQNDIEEGKELADKHGIKLQLNYSNRWYGWHADMDYEPAHHDWMKPDKEMTVPKAYISKYKEVMIEKTDLHPKCIKSYHAMAYVNSGFLLPCCWVDGTENEKEIPTLLQEHLKLENNEHVYDIIKGKEWFDFYDGLLDNPNDAPYECWRHCSTHHDTGKYGTDARRKRVFL